MESNDKLWFKNAVFYELHVKAFFDSNNDGIGDFEGLRQKLDYLKNLGVDCLWLLPFYKSPLRDDGYDIADYYNVNPQYGTIEQFRQVIKEAHQRDIRVITDLVLNHTSDQHPWFQEARSNPNSPKRDYYVWNDNDQKYPEVRIIFCDIEPSNWTYDEVAGAYYWHRFYAHQPDLNFDNPEVQQEMLNVMKYWMDMGIDGFRLDAVPYLYEREGTNGESLPETHDYLKMLRAEIDKNYTDKVLLAEANQWPRELRTFFGDGNECHMAFNFPLMPRLFLALAKEDSSPVISIMNDMPEIPFNSQWGTFLRNHDELTLEMLTEEEREEMFRFYMEEPEQRFNLGIRRRLAPLLKNDQRIIDLMNSMLFSMPGSPIIYYGDEIGMGDIVSLGDRHGVRTPMQWDNSRNAGFSQADPATLYSPVIADQTYTYEAVNVAQQLQEPDSLLNRTRRLIHLRKQTPVFGSPHIEFLPNTNEKVLVYLRSEGEEHILVVNNLSSTAQTCQLNLSRYSGSTPADLFGENAFSAIGYSAYTINLKPYGFYWLRLEVVNVD